MAGWLKRRPTASAAARTQRFLPRALAWVTLVLAVLAMHGAITELLARHLEGLGRAPPAPARMEVVYVRDMELAPPPLTAPAAPSPLPAEVRPRAPTARPAKAASAPDRGASQAMPKPARAAKPEPRPEPPPLAAEAPAADPLPEADPPAVADPVAVTVTVASAPSVAPETAPEPATAVVPVPAPELAASTPAAASAGAEGSAAAFEWPASTRVSYRLTGNVRGEVNGDAQVDWVRVDKRYQVHLDLTLGLSFAPLMTRSMSSDGDITTAGLSPRRYDQRTKIGFGARQHVTVLFEPDAVVLANGQRRERWTGVQDTASQFIQLTWLFSTRPELLRGGATIEVPLALPRNLSRWVYDVFEPEPVHTPFGAITAYPLKPRRGVAKGGDLSAEIWIAPELRYLPVRIRIQQDAETFVDLVIARKPQLAAP